MSNVVWVIVTETTLDAWSNYRAVNLIGKFNTKEDAEKYLEFFPKSLYITYEVLPCPDLSHIELEEKSDVVHRDSST